MEIFLCYPRELQQDTKKVAAFCRSIKVPYWLDVEKIVPGENWDRHRRESLRKANAVIVICGPQTNDRDGVYHREINEALSHLGDKRLGKVYLIPARAVDVDLPSELADLQYVDLFAEGWKGQLAKGLLKLYRQDGVECPPELEVAAATTLGKAPNIEKLESVGDDFEFRAEWPVYHEDTTYWKYVNGEIQTPIFRSYFQRKKWFFDGDVAHPNSYSDISVSEFFRRGEIISLVINESMYWGGAHPMHATHTKNFLGDGFGLLSFHELFSDAQKTAGYLADHVNLELKRQDYGAFDIREYSYDDDLTALFTEFAINDRGLRFNFGSNLGLPHVLSGFTIYLPWENLEDQMLDAPKQIIIDGPTKQPD
ncbi:toll/interleukin-1 receptor domain-containing protein [Qipengyuania gaetbuli]|uniref:toll/interleukin-1 receptor domain-containing protein n=1 Tax=Qipengyuania gaetbuli TaxID=266952 RepID=UPI001CD2881F|nr:toll/interleukin-1 receptor domain-containing protein [Qipengyuania gaetbuli]MCA0909042.1 toll/interleukin-1 receptor domain-containing protein [Qipengyuania gaetbuli]